MLLRSHAIVCCCFLLSGIVLSQSSVQSQASVFNVRSFGATGDGKTLDSPAINRAIEACVKAGGGTVYLPPGTYLSGSIRLKSNVHINLDMG
ncbi:MAG TPA: glycosyl hydrolase family 28-related protein, partial [Bacteroidota bacterium]|nr:glycosyl hydrolase family 28-related protein [Bacteroidota bacterium]